MINRKIRNYSIVDKHKMRRSFYIGNILAGILIGIFAGYGWRYYHEGVLVHENKAQIEELQTAILGVYDELQVEKKVQKIILCESGGKHSAIGDNGKARGIAQWHYDTFKWIKTIAHKPELNYKDAGDQVELLRWALQNGYEKLWTCS